MNVRPACLTTGVGQGLPSRWSAIIHAGCSAICWIEVQKRRANRRKYGGHRTVAPIRYKSLGNEFLSINCLRVLSSFCLLVKKKKTLLVFALICLCNHVCQGRTLADSTAGRCRRRSFMPPSFFEDETVDFPDDLDTSFFTRVSRVTLLKARKFRVKFISVVFLEDQCV